MWRRFVAAGVALLALLLLAGSTAPEPHEICGVRASGSREVTVWYAPDCPVWEPFVNGARIDTARVELYRYVVPPGCGGIGVLRLDVRAVPVTIPLDCARTRTEQGGTR